MDIEGAELNALREALNYGSLRNVNQLAIEYHINGISTILT